MTSASSLDGGHLRIGGAPVVTLHADPPRGAPAFVEAVVLPGRGMMLLNAKLRLPSGETVNGVVGPEPAEAARELDGGWDDFAGNKAFAFGGAILAPYANRIRGRPVDGGREIEALIDGTPVRLPRNWGGRAPGAEQYAMHGLILDAAAQLEAVEPDRVTGRLLAGDFGGRWPGRAELTMTWRLEDGALALRVEACNAGRGLLPIGLGWHPYFPVPSGDRRQARLRLDARTRVEVNDYDQVLPTGRLLPVAATPYDFGGSSGAALGDLHLDDCFTGLSRSRGGEVVVEIHDPAAELGFRIVSSSPWVRAVQVFAPVDRPVVAVEPQFNLTDPYGAVWSRDVDTGMAQVPPGESVSFEVRVEPFALRNR